MYQFSYLTIQPQMNLYWESLYLFIQAIGLYQNGDVNARKSQIKIIQNNENITISIKSYSSNINMILVLDNKYCLLGYYTL